MTLIERLNRTGGRLDTDIVEVKSGEIVREEEGGMRFNFGMEELMRLNYALGLCRCFDVKAMDNQPCIGPDAKEPAAKG